MTRRITALGVAMALAFGVLLFQLTNVQVFKASTYANNPNNPIVKEAQFDKSRGRILLPDGEVLAASVPSNDPASPYKYMRVYSPDASLYEDVLGFYSLDYGLYGVEASYNQFLVSHNAPVKTFGDLLSTHVVTDDVTLTLDPKIQQAAANALSQYAPNGVGAVVALDPRTGAVLAMYGNPTFDPTPLASLSSSTESQAWAADNAPDPNADGLVPLTPWPLQGAYPMGSTMKTITTAAAYDHDPSLVTKQYPAVQCISLPQSNRQLCNYGGAVCGGDIAQMLPPSCDTGYSLLAMDIGGANLTAEAQAFGFDQQPPIDLPHNQFQIPNFGGPPPPGSQPHFLDHNAAFTAYSAIGQGNDYASPLVMAMVASAFADNGVIMTPHVMKNIYDSDGNLVTSYSPTPWKTATSPATAHAVSGLMVQVARVGTAAGIFNPADDVAAKTGTAQTGTQQNPGTTAWMIAFAPDANPKIAVAVVIPKLPGYHSESLTGAAQAGPVIRAVIQAELGQ